MAEFVRPEWLGDTPYNNFLKYGDRADGETWYSFPLSEHYTHSRSCYATHTLALRGNPACLEIMRLYYLALVKRRIAR